MRGTRQVAWTDDGYLTVIDPVRGVGLICEPLKIVPPKRPQARRDRVVSWRVVSMFLRPSNGTTVDFVTDYGRS